MAGPISILLAGSTVLLISGGNKRRPRRAKRSMIGRSCSEGSTPPAGTVCRNGVLYPLIIDESMLENDDAGPPERSGKFSTRDEDLSQREDEEVGDEPDGSPTDIDPGVDDIDESDNLLKCLGFLREIHVDTNDEKEIPINRVAVEQTVIPAMQASLSAVLKENPNADADYLAPIMIISALRELVPFCNWEYDEFLYEFTFDGNTVTDSVGRDIIYGLLHISDKMIEESVQEIQG